MVKAILVVTRYKGQELVDCMVMKKKSWISYFKNTPTNTFEYMAVKCKNLKMIFAKFECFIGNYWTCRHDLSDVIQFSPLSSSYLDYNL